ncbi:MAG: phosphotransferase family protein [Chthonomonadales bacterium]|nr:phosphotransferase family protein [Chthonomonadales bacterium]
MIPPNDNTQFERLLQRIEPNSTLLRSWSLTGGVSAQVTAMEIVSADGQQQRWVVRQHGTADLARNPQIALHEFTLLQQLHAEKLPAPKPLYLDESREIFSDPILVTEYIDGTPGFPSIPAPHAMITYVELLLRIHRVWPDRTDLSFLPQQAEIVSGKLEGTEGTTEAQTVEERQVLEALREAWPHVQQRNPSVLLHGDYWPGNTLWQGEELVAVIDWEDAAIGDPLIDLANSRLEILWALGYNAMYDFTRQYQSMSLLLDTTDLPFWDLWATLSPARNISTWGLDPPIARRMHAQLQDFLRAALAARNFSARPEPIPEECEGEVIEQKQFLRYVVMLDDGRVIPDCFIGRTGGRGDFAKYIPKIGDRIRVKLNPYQPGQARILIRKMRST